MPSGYTEAVATGDETDLPSFIRRCAYALGMARERRDGDTPYAREPDIYHVDQSLALSFGSYAALLAMSPAEIAQASETAYQEQRLNWQEHVEEQAQVSARYDAMLALLDAWTPAPALRALHDFMRAQLHESKATDDYVGPAPVRLSAEEWYAQEEQALHSEIAYLSRRRAGELDRAAKDNVVLTALLEALHDLETGG